MRTFVLRACFLCFLCGFSVHSLAQAIETSVSYVSPQAAPYAYFDKNGQPVGVAVEMAKLVAEEADLNMKIYLVPSLRVYKELEKGNIDFSILPASSYADRVAERVSVMTNASVVIASLKARNIEIDSIEDMYGMSVGYLNGIEYGPAFEEAMSMIKVPVFSTEVGVEMLVKERIDLLVSFERTLAYHLSSARLRNKVQFVYELTTVNSYLYVSKASPKKALLHELFVDAIANLHSADKLSATYRHLKL